MIPKDAKVKKVLTFLHDLSLHITDKVKFSFTNKVSQYKLTWCTNAMCVQGILISHNIIYKEGGFLNFTPLGADYKMQKLAELVVDLIDGKKTYLETVISDIDHKTLDEEPIDYKKIAELYNENKGKVIKGRSGHSFPRTTHKKEFTENFVDVACVKCGAKKRIYKNGAISYFKANGKLTPINTMDCIDVQSQIEKQETQPLPLPIQETTQIKLDGCTIKPVPGVVFLNEKEVALQARLKECIVILRVMYEDMIINGINTNSRRMAGCFLYSQGYDNLIKQLENKKAC